MRVSLKSLATLAVLPSALAACHSGNHLECGPQGDKWLAERVLLIEKYGTISVAAKSELIRARTDALNAALEVARLCIRQCEGCESVIGLPPEIAAQLSDQADSLSIERTTIGVERDDRKIVLGWLNAKVDGYPIVLDIEVRPHDRPWVSVGQVMP